MQSLRTSILAILGLSTPAAPQQQQRRDDMPVTPTLADSVALATADAIATKYVFAQKGEDAARIVRRSVRAGRYRALATASALTDSLTAELRRASGDQHLQTGAPEAVTLHFQVIEAGDFAGSDSAIARVVAPLRETFRYRGYRLVADLTLRTLAGSQFAQHQADIRVGGTVREVSTRGPDPRVTLDLTVETSRGAVTTSVSGAPGKTLVIGTQQAADRNGALIAAVTPTIEAAQP